MDNLISGLGFSRKKSFDDLDEKAAAKPNDANQPDEDFDLSDDAVVEYQATQEDVEDDTDTFDKTFSESEIQEGSALTSAVSERQSTSNQGGIGPKIFIRGEIVGEEDLLIQGKVEGSIDLSGHHLTIGVNGAVIANVKAKVVTIEGNVAGDVSAEELIEIKASSQVKGNLVCERVVLEDGARFRGSIDMSVDELADETPFKTKATSKDSA